MWASPRPCHSEPVLTLAWESVSPRLPLRGRCQREALAEGERPRAFLSPSRLRRQPPPRGGLTARRCRAVIARRAATRQSVFLFWGDGFPRQSADWLGMTGSRGGRLCPPCMTAAPCRAGPVCPAVTGVAIRPPPQIPSSKSQQFAAKFCAPIQNVKISPETVAQGAEECYILTVNRIRAAPRKGRRVVFLGGMHL